jgi:hypothetical protein
MSEANKKQIGGTHYKGVKLEPWDYIHAHRLDFFEGNIVKYITRYHSTHNLNDLLKVEHYVEKLKELNETRDE